MKPSEKEVNIMCINCEKNKRVVQSGGYDL